MVVSLDVPADCARSMVLTESLILLFLNKVLQDLLSELLSLDTLLLLKFSSEITSSQPLIRLLTKPLNTGSDQEDNLIVENLHSEPHGALLVMELFITPNHHKPISVTLQD